MTPSDLVRVHHMIETARIIAKFVEGRRRADLDSDTELSFAIVRAIEIFGEAASKISPDTRSQAPELPWQAIIGMRNRLIHAYFDINHDTVWIAATQEIPELLPILLSLI
jgi:uncharacterized protein with HEPN domain